MRLSSASRKRAFLLDELAYYHAEAFALLVAEAGAEAAAIALDPWFRQERLLERLLAALPPPAAAVLVEELVFEPYRDPAGILAARRSLGIADLPDEPPPALLAADPLELAPAFCRAAECFPGSEEMLAELRGIHDAEPRLADSRQRPALVAEATAALSQGLASLEAGGRIRSVENPARSGRFEDLVQLFDYPSFQRLLRSLELEDVACLLASGPDFEAKVARAFDARSLGRIRDFLAARGAKALATREARERILGVLRRQVEEGEWLAWRRYLPKD